MLDNEQALLEANKAVRLDPMKQRRGKSKQDFGTPREVLDGIERRFGKIGIDLAAREDNKVCERFISPEQDTLKINWSELIVPEGHIRFINPPYANLEPFAKQLAATKNDSRFTIMLCPASMGSKWWVKHVLGQVNALGIPRVKFRGADSIYPKDLSILVAGFGLHGFGYFDWRKA